MIIKNLFSILNQKQLFFFFIINLIIFFSALLEMIGISFIIPILSYILNQDNLTYFNEKFIDIYLANYKFNLNYFLIFVLIFFIFKFIFLFFSTIIQSHFVKKLQINLSNNIFKSYMNLSFEKFLDKKSSSLIKNISTEIQYFAIGVRSILMMITEFFLIVTILSLLVVYNYQITLVLFLIFGSFFFIYKYFTSNKLTFISKEREQIESNLIKFLQSFFGLFKEILIYQKKEYFTKKNNFLVKRFAEIFKTQFIIVQAPKYFLELVSVFLFLGIIFYYYNNEKNQTELLTMLGLFALATFRVLPSINRLISGFNEYKFYGPSINIIYDEIKEFNKSVLKKNNHISEKLDFQNSLELQNIYFQYGKNKIFQNFNMKFFKGDKVAILGQSGSGKTTLLNLIIGILKPHKGKILVDDSIILNEDNIDLWQKILGYVPQNIVMMDDTIENNISLEENNLNLNRFKDVISRSCIDNFINKLDLKEKTQVGELGNKLSGGQLQRIGIARALYKNSELLILDEATSSLDKITEQQILEEIFKKNKNLTVILVTHREENCKFCNKVIRLD